LEINPQETIYLFTDGSVNPQEKIGFGAYLLINKNEFTSNTLQEKIKLKKFEDTSSTKLELQTLLWALSEINDISAKFIVYTDCQNILTLNNRRKRFEENDYYSKTNKCINNHLLYKEFFILQDKYSCEFIKVKGHKQKSQKDEVDKIFTLVDKSSRNALREYFS